MACDLATQRKRLGWEKLDDEAAPTFAGRGFSNTGSMPKYYWCQPLTLQVAPQWIFLNFGVLLNFVRIFADSVEYGYGQLLPPSSVLMKLTGFNSVITPVGAGAPFTVTFTTRIGGTAFTPGPEGFAEQNVSRIAIPNPTDAFGLQTWTNAVPGLPAPTFVGPLIITPLKQCHNCVTGP